MITAADFVAMYPEFADVTVYPTLRVTAYIGLAYEFLNQCKWRNQLDFGAGLWTAHQLAIGAQRAAAAANGGIPGTTGGVLQSKAVDKVSAGYDTGATTYEGAGFWNLTNYGTQLWDLMLMFGAGGFVTGEGWLPQGPGVGGLIGGWPF